MLMIFKMTIKYILDHGQVKKRVSERRGTEIGWGRGRNLILKMSLFFLLFLCSSSCLGKLDVEKQSVIGEILFANLF
jgi:hypothetical protein